MENKDQTPEGNEEEPQTPPEETAGEDTPEEEAPEQPEVDYKAKFKASQSEAIRLAKEVESLKKTPPEDKDLPEEKEKIFGAISEYERRKEAEAKAEQAKIAADLDKLHVIHGDFDDNKLKDIVKKYGVYDDDGNIAWERAYELHERFGGQVEYKPKKKSGGRTQDKPVEVEPVNVRGKDFHSIIQDFKKKLGA